MFEKKEKKKKFLQSRNKVETLCLSVCLSVCLATRARAPMPKNASFGERIGACNNNTFF